MLKITVFHVHGSKTDDMLFCLWSECFEITTNENNSLSTALIHIKFRRKSAHARMEFCGKSSDGKRKFNQFDLTMIMSYKRF